MQYSSISGYVNPIKLELNMILAAFFVSLALAELKVMSPVSLAQTIGNDGDIKASLGNFGHLNYGATQIGRVVMPKNNSYGCQPFNNSDFNHSLVSPVLFIMVNRG